uniref:Sugar transporter SWEET1 n=1 Tax=Albugo laibachii Nc14 TaxID=890382 RepID=F0W7E2_9STRA|nr:conserved hypothetical protein [Albugo laibachii Nc14]|eukprot:CCA17041.1 conserved hypothetical protein [Albugo laibachii Nc14]
MLRHKRCLCERAEVLDQLVLYRYGRYIDRTNMSSWQSMENALLVSTLFMTKTIPVVAAGSSLVFAISPLTTTRSIQRAKSTLQYPFAPFFFFFIQNVITLLYAYATWNHIIALTAALSSSLGAYYVFIYYTHCSQKTRPRQMLCVAAFGVLLLTVNALPRKPEDAQWIIGVPSLILSILTSSSPLMQIRDILERKDASCLPFGMSVMNLISGSVWSLYGCMLKDPWIIIPNIIALSMGIVQVSLIFLYPSKSSRKAGWESDGAIERAD